MSTMCLGLNRRNGRNLRYTLRGNFMPFLKAGAMRTDAGELAGMAAGQVEGDEPAHALAEQKDLLSREVPLDRLPQGEDVAVPDAKESTWPRGRSGVQPYPRSSGA